MKDGCAPSVAVWQQQRGVAVAEEPVAPVDRVGVDLAHPLKPDKRRDQHHQRRFRQVEVGHQRVGDPEREAGADEDVGRPAPGGNVAGGVGGAFDQPERGGADRDHPAAGGLGGVDLGGGGVAHLAPFGMHLVLRHVVDLHRQECAGADVQGDTGRRHPPGGERGEQGLVEMQRGGGGGNGAGLVGPDRLVIVAVLRVGFAPGLDVRRQRHLPGLGQRRVEIRAREVEDEPGLAVAAAKRAAPRAGRKTRSPRRRAPCAGA